MVGFLLWVTATEKTCYCIVKLDSSLHERASHETLTHSLQNRTAGDHSETDPVSTEDHLGPVPGWCSHYSSDISYGIECITITYWKLSMKRIAITWVQVASIVQYLDCVVRRAQTRKVEIVQHWGLRPSCNLFGLAGIWLRCRSKHLKALVFKYHILKSFMLLSTALR